MDQLNFSFWLGLALAIPISIFSNLITPSASQWWAKKSKSRSALQAKALIRDLRDVEHIAAEPGRHQIFLLESVLFVTLLTSFVGIFVGGLFALSTLVFGGSKAFALAAQFFPIVGGVLVIREILDTLRKSKQVKNVDAYRKEVAAKLQELGGGESSV